MSVLPGVAREDEDDVLVLVAGRRRRWWWAAELVLVGLVGLVASRMPRVQAWARGEVDWRGQRIYEPTQLPALEQIDLGRVHGELLPRWLVAQGRRADGEDGAVEDEVEAFAVLREAVAPDGNLAALLDELHELSPPSRLAEAPSRALYLTWAWNHYLDRQGAPFLVQGSVHARGFGPLLAATIHRVHTDAAVAVGVGLYRVRVTSRIDGTSWREQYLGAAGKEDALVVIDRLRDFALDEVWPLLDPLLELPAGLRGFAEPVRREARARLSSAAMRELERTAAARWSMLEILHAIEDRRRTCGSGFRINAVPWSGVLPEQLARLEEVAQRHEGRDCPGITPAEVLVLERASEALGPDPTLEAALEELVALTAEHVAIHEARHLADAALADGFDEPLPCASCTAAMGIAARAELSGYLASFAWSPSPALALHQACRSLAAAGGRPLAPGEPHREALELLQRRTGAICANGPPEGLRALSRHLELEMLGRSDPIALPITFPRRLPLAGL